MTLIAQTISSLSAEFTDRIEALRKISQSAVDAIQGKAQNQWFVPASAADRLMDPSFVPEEFDRTTLNDQYIQIVSGESGKTAGNLADIQALRYQLGYMTAEERAYRERYTTPARTFVLAHATRRGQAQGPLWAPDNGLLNYLAKTLGKETLL